MGQEQDAPHRTAAPDLLLELARGYDRKGYLEDAAWGYEAAAHSAEAWEDTLTLAEALRRLAVVRHRTGRPAEARALATRSRGVALAGGETSLAAEAVNALGGFELVEERFDRAGELFREARALAGEVTGLLGRIEQNLGTIQSLQGDFESAMGHYQRSLHAFLAAGDEHGCAIAYHNLGVASMELHCWEEADGYLRRCLRSLDATGDVHLLGVGQLNHAETLVALGRLREARLAVETATAIFDELRAPVELADAFRVFGVVCRESGELAAARAKLVLALEMAEDAGSALTEAETRRELAVLAVRAGRREEAVEQLVRSTAILLRVRGGVRAAPTDSDGHPAAIRGWGTVLAAAEPESAAHADRVARVAGATAEALGCRPDEVTRIRLAALLHESGRLLRPQGSSADGRALPDAGADLVDRAQLPAAVAQAIRAHRERYDGAGYPAGLAAEAVPVEAQVLGIADRWDELAHAAPSSIAAVGRLAAERKAWRPDVYAALLGVIGRGSGSSAAPRYRAPASPLPSAR
jgi:HD-GYP domain-containing protein (c-di-GMP phosphodiesterase class II)